jgi:hypothetical protein
MTSKPIARDAARNLFFQSDLTQAQIARQVGVNSKTLYRWMKEGDWKNIKESSRRMPARIVDDFRSHLVQMNENIFSRPQGENIPTIEEATIMSKLVLCMTRMKVQVTQSNSIQILQNYMDLLDFNDHELALASVPHATEFLKGKGKNGFSPYDFEYDPGPKYYEQFCPPSGSEDMTLSSHEDAFNPNQLELPFPDEPVAPSSFQTSRTGLPSGHDQALPQKDEKAPESVPGIDHKPTALLNDLLRSGNNNLPGNRLPELNEAGLPEHERGGGTIQPAGSIDLEMQEKIRKAKLRNELQRQLNEEARKKGLWKARSLPSDYLEPGTPEYEERERKRRQAIEQTLKEMRRENHKRNRDV